MARLLEQRNLTTSALSQHAGTREEELRAFIDGGTPSPSLLRHLAPALNLHTPDLFVVAGLPVPEDLTPLDAAAGRLLDRLVWCAFRLPPEQRHRLRQTARSLPQEERTQPFPASPPREQYPPGPGATILRMLHNRNLNWIGSAKCLARLTPHYLAASTIGQVGHGRKELSPELVASFSTVLAIPPDDLAALTGIKARSDAAASPAASNAAELIWDARRLTAAQVQQVVNEAESMLAECTAGQGRYHDRA